MIMYPDDMVISNFKIETPADIPIIVDDVKNYEDFKMTRFNYFTIECDEPVLNWALELSKEKIPFHLMGLSGLVIKPLKKANIFENLDHITELFQKIEDHPSLYIDTNDIWLPNDLLNGPKDRGSVYRISNELFNKAHLFRESNISFEDFNKWCQQLKSLIHYSDIETNSFKAWQKKQIDDAINLYPKDKNSKLEYIKEEKKEK
jgi:hypothetical protein